MTYTDADLIPTIDSLAPDLAMGTPTADKLRSIDQFHAGGMEAVDRLVPDLVLDRQCRLLDVGSGLGGPARRVAQLTGCQVVGVDITAAYVAAAEELTRRCGMDDTVTFKTIDIADFRPETLFDAALTMHVQMSVPDKATWFAEIARCLRPGAYLTLWDVCRTGDKQPTWPVPWSLDGTDSFLATPDELREAVEAGGFETVTWEDESAWVQEWFTTTVAAGPPVLPRLLRDGIARTLNFASGLTEGVLVIQRGRFFRS